ncbi:hypothetical protein TPA0905_73600 [Streptomyces olivaceus]|nr:hypothetical protein TPA0905_73600 [Streptomyces olivaceus]
MEAFEDRIVLVSVFVDGVLHRSPEKERRRPARHGGPGTLGGHEPGGNDDPRRYGHTVARDRTTRSAARRPRTRAARNCGSHRCRCPPRLSTITTARTGPRRAPWTPRADTTDGPARMEECT